MGALVGKIPFLKLNIQPEDVPPLIMGPTMGPGHHVQVFLTLFLTLQHFIGVLDGSQCCMLKLRNGHVTFPMSPVRNTDVTCLINEVPYVISIFAKAPARDFV